ncbi:MAG TPA: Fic family protein [Clostridiaceae bacterium]|nr:Fic family protein [Clostridiaceae bacterium]
MKIEKFRSGLYLKQDNYKTFRPTLINHTWKWEDTELNVLLEQASAEIGSLNSFSDLIPNIDIYIKMHIKTEANKSSKIEGTKTSIEEDFMQIEDISPEKRDDYEEVHNYIRALNYGINRIVEDDFPLCNRLICEIHEQLLQGVRGEHKMPGEFRKSQNWIGGSMPSNAMYVPPSIIDLPELMSDFEKFINNDDISVPHLIKVAILHYQFETIHPFLDGNGRIGRLIIPLYLLSKGSLDKPCFYISDYFERNRNEYYRALDMVRTKNDLMNWLRFFLKASIYTAKTAKNKFKKVTILVNQLNKDILDVKGRPENTIKVLEAFYNDPVLTGKQINQITNISQSTIDTILRDMVEKGMLEEITGLSRNRIFKLKEYFEIFAYNA